MQFDALARYLREIESNLRRSNATIYTHRSALKRLLESSAPGILATHTPRACGAPHFIVESEAAPCGYIEAIDIATDLDLALNTEPLARHLKALPNLLLTNYLEFRWFVEGKPRLTARAGELTGSSTIRGVAPEATYKLLRSFLSPPAAVLRSPRDLARRIAAIAQLIRSTLEDALKTASAGDPLLRQLDELRHAAIKNIEASQFADMYAQTLCYGLFAARCDPRARPGPFTRESASFDLLRADPPLQRLFGRVAGPDLDPRIAWAVDHLVDLLNRVDIAIIVRAFGEGRRREDPVVHFYEAFLSEYNPQLRALRGVYYTPEPIVHYIVRSVDHVLKTTFALAEGLGDATPPLDRPHKRPRHEVRILDPAAGTGTFLSAVIRLIHEKSAASGDLGAWSDYVSQDLLPRLFGFELMMAPYAVAHMKLRLQLIDTGYNFRSPERLRMSLTDTLEEPHRSADLPPFHGHSNHSNHPNHPIMVVLGNPPYANLGRTNRGSWILDLLKDYKKDLNERKINLDDAFIKFIRFSQWCIDRTGAGVLAFVVSNTFLDGITHRRMRESLLESFSELYILDLHGSSKKRERAPTHERDENVFDIQQGVSVVIMVKAPQARRSHGPCKVWHADLWGARQHKYRVLEETEISTTKWAQLDPIKPYFFFVPKNFELDQEYSAYTPLHPGVFPRKNTGIQTKRDHIAYHIEAEELEAVLRDLQRLPRTQFARRYGLPEDGRDWTFAGASADLRSAAGQRRQVLYHPFDLRWTWYSGHTKGFMAYPRSPLMQSALRPNLLLLSVRNARRGNVDSVFVASTLADKDAVSPFDNATFFPLYIYPLGATPPTIGEGEQRSFNVSPGFIDAFPWRAEPPGGPQDPRHEQLFYYIYAILHAPSYRARYADWLRIDYPRIPRTSERELLYALVEQGRDLVDLHLMRRIEPTLSSFLLHGDNTVERPRYDNNRVYINSIQHFDNVPEAAWNLRIGGYPVLDKWLKERKRRKLTLDEIQHFHHVVAALTKTADIMTGIDRSIRDHGGWPLK